MSALTDYLNNRAAFLTEQAQKAASDSRVLQEKSVMAHEYSRECSVRVDELRQTLRLLASGGATAQEDSVNVTGDDAPSDMTVFEVIDRMTNKAAEGDVPNGANSIE